MALLVPARAIALCCFDRLVDTGPLVGAHSPTSHHGHDSAGGGETFGAATPAVDCPVPAAPVPLLRERNRSDDGPNGGDHAALSSAAILIVFVSPGERSGHPDPSAAQVGRARVSHPLRL
jgi:hypothetical protein